MNGLDEQKPSRRLWIFAAVTAVALHAGGAALAIAHLQTDDDDDSLGANVIDIGLELASPRTRRPICRRARIPMRRWLRPRLPSRRPRSNGNRPAKGYADRDRRSRPDRDAERLQEAERRRSEDRGGADLGLAGIRGAGSDRAARCSRTHAEGETSDAPQSGASARTSSVLTADLGAARSAPISSCTSATQGRPRSRKPRSRCASCSTACGHVVSLDDSAILGRSPLFDEAALVDDPPLRSGAAAAAGLTDDTFSFSLDVNFKGGSSKLMPAMT